MGERMLTLFVAGTPLPDIGREFGVHRRVVTRILRNILLDRADQMSAEKTEIARALVTERVEMLIQKVMPLATGGLTGLPDLDAVREMVNMLKLYCQLNNVPLNGPPEVRQEAGPTFVVVEQIRDEVMSSLDQVAARARAIEGSLAD